VVSVENTGSPEQKIVKLRITVESIMFGRVYGGNNENGRPVEFSDNFEIIYSPSILKDKQALFDAQAQSSTSSSRPTNPYYFRIYKRDDSSNLQVIPYRYYTHIKENEDQEANLSTSWVIKSVQPLTASR
jgi:hypothetical protein